MTGDAGARSARPTDLFRAADAIVTPAGGGRALAVSRDGQAPTLIPEAHARLLARCGRFRTVADHAQGDAAAIEALQQLRALGLLEAWGDVAAGGLLRATPTRRLERVGIVTRERPAAAARGVASLRERLAIHARSPAIVLYDDSDQPVPIAGTTTFARQDARALADRLAARADVDPAIVRWALFATPGAWAPGANYNRALLAGAGTDSCVFDDDVLFESYATQVRGGTGLAGIGDGPRLWPYRSRDEAFAAHVDTRGDPLAAHEAVLGRSVAEVVRDNGPFTQVANDLPSPVFRAVVDGRARVALSSLGSLGDCGMASPHWYVQQAPDSLLRFAKDDATWAWARSTRALLRAPDRLTLSSGFAFMSMAWAVDRHALVPPFLPELRAADAMFARLLRHTDDGALIAHHPLAIRHDPLEARAYPPDDVWRVLARPSIVEWLFWVIDVRGLGGPGDATSRLRGLGSTLLEFSALPRDALVDFLRVRWFRRNAERAASLDGMRAHPPTVDGRRPCAGWAEDVARCVDVLHRAIDDGQLPHPHEVPAGRDGVDALRELLRDFGKLLTVWDAVWDAARRG